MMNLRTNNRSSKLLAAVAVSLYALALMLGAVHPLLHESPSEQEHIAYGLCGTGCEDHHAGVEKCATCATLIKNVTNPYSAGLALNCVDTPAATPTGRDFSDSTDTRLPGLRAPPATV